VRYSRNQIPRYLSTDIGNSRLYSDYYSSVVRYVPERKLWYIFSGKRWEPDIGGLKAMELCKKLANALMVYAFNISDEQQRKDYIDRCKKWQARRTRETILKDAQGVYPIPMDAFDRDPFLFNCQNGTIHLRDMSSCLIRRRIRSRKSRMSCTTRCALRRFDRLWTRS
jgi:putative DNA primase/helicase